MGAHANRGTGTLNKEAHMETIKQIFMRRDRLSAAEADEAIDYARQRVDDGDDPEEVLYEDFGLEPDWVFELLEY